MTEGNSRVGAPSGDASEVKKQSILRVAFVMPTLQFPDLRVSNEVRALLGAGFEVSALCEGRKGSPRFSEEEGVSVERINWPVRIVKLCNLILKITSYRCHPLWSRRIKRFIRGGGFDLVLVLELRPFFISAKEARRRGLPVVLDLREDYPEMHKGSQPRLSARIFNSIEKIERIQRDVCVSADRVLVASPMFVDGLHQRYPDVATEKIVLVANTPDVEMIEELRSTGGVLGESKTFTITYIGSIGTPERGLQIAIAAMPRIRESIEEARLLLVGDGGYLPVLRKQVAVLGLDEMVEFRGRVDFAQVPDIILQSTVCIIPALNTSYQAEIGYPLKLFQYMLLEKPVVVSDCHEMKRVVEGSGAGLVFEAGDMKGYTDCIVALKDPGLRRSLGKKGREAVLGEYNFTADGGRLVELCRELGG